MLWTSEELLTNLRHVQSDLSIHAIVQTDVGEQIIIIVLTLIETRQIKYNIHKNKTAQKHSTNNTEHSNYKCTY